MQRFTGRVAVVTGAASGLGAALARRLAAEGMAVALADIDLQGAREVAAGLRQDGRNARAFAVDVGEPASIAALAESVADELGTCALLCPNVGVQQFGPLERLSLDEWRWVFGVNVFGAVACVNAFLPQLRAGEEAHVLFTSSTGALHVSPRVGVYNASKSALLSYAETLRLELAEEGIGVSALIPGGMYTTHLQSSAAAKPAGLEAPAFTDEDVAFVGRDMSGEPMVEPDHAIRNLIPALRADEPYIVTHPAFRELIEARFSALRRALDRAGD